jgi:hypothetical protein
MLQRLVPVLVSAVLAGSVWTLGLFMLVTQLSAASANGMNSLAVTLQSDKQNFLLGEPISLMFKVVNNSTAVIELPGLIGVGEGTLTLRISFENGPFRLYRGPRWYISGRRTRTPPTLNPGGSIEIKATVLHNRAPQRGTLNDQTWARIVSDDIDTEIALPKPGRYRFKAILFGKIESPPFEIHITEPQRIDDIEIWKVISNQPEYAFFMQSGDLLQGTLTDQRTKDMVDALEAFINYHAASTYTPHFRAAIAKHRADVERYLNATKLK